MYNIAPPKSNYITNMKIIRQVLKRLQKDPCDFIEHVADRAAHDTSYFLFSSDYSSDKTYKDDLNDVIDWYAEKYVDGKAV